MNKENVCIATITWARDESEEKLLRDALLQLAALGMLVYVTDGGSQSSFLDFIRSLPGFVLLPPTEKGVWPQAKNSIAAACQSGAPFIFYTEPDKQDFFRQGMPVMINNIQADDALGIAVASRSETSFATFPPFQQMTETAINNCCAEIAGEQIDYTYGPFLVNRKLVPHVLQMKEDTGWGWRPYAFCLAKLLGYKIASYEADFFCPEHQRQDHPSERIYRMRQLSQNIQGMVLASTASLTLV